MDLSETSLEERIKTVFPDVSFVKAYDISGGCGQSFEVVIVSNEFQGLNTLKRHRLVNARLKDEIAAVHAFVQRTFTPECILCLHIDAAFKGVQQQFKNTKIEGVSPENDSSTTDKPADVPPAP